MQKANHWRSEIKNELNDVAHFYGVFYRLRVDYVPNNINIIVLTMRASHLYMHMAMTHLMRKWTWTWMCVYASLISSNTFKNNQSAKKELLPTECGNHKYMYMRTIDRASGPSFPTKTTASIHSFGKGRESERGETAKNTQKHEKNISDIIFFP